MIDFKVQFDLNFIGISGGLIHLRYFNNDTKMVDGKSFKKLSDLIAYYQTMEDSNLKYLYKEHIKFLVLFFNEIIQMGQ